MHLIYATEPYCFDDLSVMQCQIFLKFYNYLGTIAFGVLGIAAIAVWVIMYMYSPFDNYYELSNYLFPLSSRVLKLLFPKQSIPGTLVFGGFLGEWLATGALVDVVRYFVRARLKKPMA